MSLTFGQAKEIVRPYCGVSGKSLDSPELNNFVLKVLQYLLITGSPGGEKMFEFYTGKGFFTAPYELETPLKVLVNGKVGNAVNKWFEFRSGPNLCEGFMEASNNLIEDPNPYYTSFEGPSTGFIIGVKSYAEEDSKASIIISGQDVTGKDIFTEHKGADISGELLEIEKNIIHWSNVEFGNINGVLKTVTCGYVCLYWKDCYGNTGLLSEYSPVDEAPTYRRFKLKIADCPEYAKITVLGRTRLKNYYADSDRIPFDMQYQIEVAAQQVQAQTSDQLDSANQKDNFLVNLIDRESIHKKVNNGTPLEYYYPTSGGTIKGINRR